MADRNKHLHVVVSEEELTALHGYADELGVSVADAVRLWIRKLVKQAKKGGRRDAAT